jgi:hypothetical protein
MAEAVTTLATSDFWLIGAFHDGKFKRGGVVDRDRLRRTPSECQSRTGARTRFLGREKTVQRLPTGIRVRSANSKQRKVKQYRGFRRAHPPFISPATTISALLNRPPDRAYARSAQAPAALPNGKKHPHFTGGRARPGGLKDRRRQHVGSG